MAGTAVNNSTSRIWMDTTLVTDGDFSTGTGSDADDLGYMAEDGSEVGNPEVITEPIFIGDASVGATYSATIRVLGNAVHASVASAFVANPPTIVYLYFPNISLTRYSAVKCILSEGFVESASSNPKRTSWTFKATAKGDAVSDFHNYYAAAIVVPG